MAKIQYTALVEEIKGSLGGSTIKGHKAGSILKQKTTPRRPRTQAQQRLRGYVNQVSGDWYSLSDTNKELWNKYASLLSDKLSGFNTFIRLNTRLLKSSHASLVQINSPPVTPGTPRHLESVTRETLNLTQRKITWTAPLTSDDYIDLYYAIQAGYSVTDKEAWHHVETVRSDVGEITHTHAYPDGTVMNYRARTIDIWGRLSPWCSVLESATFGAFYGEEYYGAGFYGA